MLIRTPLTTCRVAPQSTPRWSAPLGVQRRSRLVASVTDDVVVAAVDATGHFILEGYDPATGDRLWLRDLPRAMSVLWRQDAFDRIVATSDSGVAHLARHGLRRFEAAGLLPTVPATLDATAEHAFAVTRRGKLVCVAEDAGVVWTMDAVGAGWTGVCGLPGGDVAASHGRGLWRLSARAEKVCGWRAPEGTTVTVTAALGGDDVLVSLASAAGPRMAIVKLALRASSRDLGGDLELSLAPQGGPVLLGTSARGSLCGIGSRGVHGVRWRPFGGSRGPRLPAGWGSLWQHEDQVVATDARGAEVWRTHAAGAPAPIGTGAVAFLGRAPRVLMWGEPHAVMRPEPAPEALRLRPDAEREAAPSTYIDEPMPLR